MNGGYNYAKTFFEEVFRFAEKEIGFEYILSAVTIALRLAPERIKEMIGKVFSENKEKVEFLRSEPMPPLFNTTPLEKSEWDRVRER